MIYLKLRLEMHNRLLENVIIHALKDTLKSNSIYDSKPKSFKMLYLTLNWRGVQKSDTWPLST